MEHRAEAPPNALLRTIYIRVCGKQYTAFIWQCPEFSVTGSSYAVWQQLIQEYEQACPGDYYWLRPTLDLRDELTREYHEAHD